MTKRCYFFQYLFIFVFKSFGRIDEDFFAFFTTILIFLVWIAFDFVYMYLPGKKGINYYMCTGEDPAIDEYQYKKVQFN